MFLMQRAANCYQVNVFLFRIRLFRKNAKDVNILYVHPFNVIVMYFYWATWKHFIPFWWFFTRTACNAFYWPFLGFVVLIISSYMKHRWKSEFMKTKAQLPLFEHLTNNAVIGERFKVGSTISAALHLRPPILAVTLLKLLSRRVSDVQSQGMFKTMV